MTANDQATTRVLWNEDDLRADVVRVWGEYGAHADLLDHLIRLARDARRYRRALEGIAKCQTDQATCHHCGSHGYARQVLDHRERVPDQEGSDV